MGGGAGISGMGGGAGISGMGGGAGIVGTGGSGGGSASARPALWPKVAIPIPTTALHLTSSCVSFIWPPVRCLAIAVTVLAVGSQSNHLRADRGLPFAKAWNAISSAQTLDLRAGAACVPAFGASPPGLPGVLLKNQGVFLHTPHCSAAMQARAARRLSDAVGQRTR